jgi:hypothetical protein
MTTAVDADRKYWREVHTLQEPAARSTRGSSSATPQEDGGFKLDRITFGADVTLGVGWVHYGVTMGDGSELGADAFLMKGSDVPPRSRWGGNPAYELRDDELPSGLTALFSRSVRHDGHDDGHDDGRDDGPTESNHHSMRNPYSMEEFMEVSRNHAADGSPPALPTPRSAGDGHRAGGRQPACAR